MFDFQITRRTLQQILFAIFSHRYLELSSINVYHLWWIISQSNIVRNNKSFIYGIEVFNKMPEILILSFTNNYVSSYMYITSDVWHQPIW